MARTIRDASLETRAARDKLAGRRGKVHWRMLVPGKLALGYRRTHKGAPGTWLVRIYRGSNGVGGGKYTKRPLGLADDYADADGYSVLSYAQAAALAAGRPAGPLTVALACEAYVEALAAKGQPTGDAEGRIKRHVLPTLGDLRVEELTAARLQSWLADLARGADDDPEAVRQRRSTANRVLNVLKAALNHAYDAGRAPSNDAWGRRLKPFRKVDAARVRYLTVAEAKRLINAADKDSGFRDLVLAALNTGCRFGELARLEVADFDPDAATVAVRQSKSGRPRHVHLTDQGTAHLAALATGRPGDEPLLIYRGVRRQRNGGAWQASDQIRPMADAVRRARISPPISFHGLRHTYASLAIMAGVPMQVVAANLGHVGVGMVERHYGHLAASYVREAIRAGAPRFAAGRRSNVRAMR